MTISTRSILDLRAMGTTGVLAERPPPMTRIGASHARDAFRCAGPDGRTEEIVEILHFIAWTK